MRTTDVRYAQNIGAQFRALWLMRRKRRVADTGAEAILAARGIQAVNPKHALSPTYERLNEEVPKWLSEEAVAIEDVEKQPCHVFTNIFTPIANVEQVQLLTNSLVRNSLPDSILENATENSSEDDERVKEAILHAHLLDSHQEKLPKILDVINNPGINFPREYGIPLKRKTKLLTYRLLLLLDQLFPEGASRLLVEDTLTRVSLNHGERLMQIDVRAGFILSSPKPLPALLNLPEVRSLDGEPLPDIYPMSPFVNVHARNNYTLCDTYGVGSSRLHPHTIFIHHNEPRMRGTEERIYALSLFHAFAHAASYAKDIGKATSGDLDEPVVVNLVHIINSKFHISTFQLNTLNLTGPTKNVFWMQPWETLYETCAYEGVKPVLTGYNPRIFSLLKGVYFRS